jgi:hypothetical protein
MESPKSNIWSYGPVVDVFIVAEEEGINMILTSSTSRTLDCRRTNKYTIAMVVREVTLTALGESKRKC